MANQEKCPELAFSLVMWFSAPSCGQIQNMLLISPKRKGVCRRALDRRVVKQVGHGYGLSQRVSRQEPFPLFRFQITHGHQPSNSHSGSQPRKGLHPRSDLCVTRGLQPSRETSALLW